MSAASSPGPTAAGRKACFTRERRTSSRPSPWSRPWRRALVADRARRDGEHRHGAAPDRAEGLGFARDLFDGHARFARRQRPRSPREHRRAGRSADCGATGRCGSPVRPWQGGGAGGAHPGDHHHPFRSVHRVRLDQLMDREWPEEQREKFLAAAREYPELAGLHDFRTRTSGTHHFAQFHVWVPADWTIAEDHERMDRVEEKLQHRFPGTEILMHLDPEGHTDRETMLPPEITEKAS